MAADTSFHYLLMANQAMVQKQLYKEMGDTSLTSGQPKILDFLIENDGANQRSIAQGCRIEPSSLTSVLNRMEDGGLIERRMHEGDRRSFYIYVTEKGRKYQERINAEFQRIEARALAGISEEELAVFQKVFHAIYENLNQQEKK